MGLPQLLLATLLLATAVEIVSVLRAPPEDHRTSMRPRRRPF
ncbi:hypothetical protein BAMBUS_05220 [Brevundimonas phage vB_BpoS-Bambus]|nr:hypothetical protein BAMBUS_05220 [Brevundimonas phage vB_BpoS-Bambus]